LVYFLKTILKRFSFVSFQPYFQEKYKMKANSKRNYQRMSQNSPICFAHFNTEDFHDALMCNICPAGMYFESDSFLRQNSDIHIKVVNQLPERKSTGAYNFYRANVKWCKEISQNDPPWFGAGVQFTVRSQSAGGPVYLCGLCGDVIPGGKIHQIEDFVYLCSACFNHFEELPDGKLKEIAEGFMNGNIL
jgi:hypothetical protein